MKILLILDIALCLFVHFFSLPFINADNFFVKNYIFILISMFLILPLVNFYKKRSKTHFINDEKRKSKFWKIVTLCFLVYGLVNFMFLCLSKTANSYVETRNGEYFLYNRWVSNGTYKVERKISETEFYEFNAIELRCFSAFLLSFMIWIFIDPDYEIKIPTRNKKLLEFIKKKFYSKND